MRSLRLDDDLDRQLRRAAAVEGESVSEFIRVAAADRATETLRASARDQLADVIGVVHGRGGRARRSGEAFADALRDARR